MRYSLLDLLRALAVFSLVIYHVSIKTGCFFARPILSWSNKCRLDISDLAISLLIILSGLVLTLEYKNIKLTFKRFILKRLLRIYSVYLLIFLFTLILFFIINTGYQIKSGEFLCTLTGFCAFFGFWNPAHQPFFFGLITTGWFIGLIVILYLFYPYALYFIRKYKFYALFVLFILSLCSSLVILYSPLFDMMGLKWFPLNRLFEFGLGIYLALILKPTVWTVLNKKIKWNVILKFAGEISFPLFLVHFPLLYIYFDLMRIIGVNVVLALLLYLAVSVWVSWFFLYLSKIILRKFNYSAMQ